jgi:hypothetical protein
MNIPVPTDDKHAEEWVEAPFSKFTGKMSKQGIESPSYSDSISAGGECEGVGVGIEGGESVYEPGLDDDMFNELNGSPLVLPISSGSSGSSGTDSDSSMDGVPLQMRSPTAGRGRGRGRGTDEALSDVVMDPNPNPTAGRGRGRGRGTDEALSDVVMDEIDALTDRHIREFRRAHMTNSI